MVENVILLAQDSLGDIIVISRRGDYSALGLPGGKIDPGETHLTALQREIQEELGYSLDPTQVELVYSGDEDGTLTHTYQLHEPIELSQMETVNDEDCYITTVETLAHLTDPNVSPFHAYNAALHTAIY